MMWREEFGPDVLVHVVKRGAHRMPIVRDDSDRWRFLKLLRYLNDQQVPRNWEREIGSEHVRDNFRRPSSWPDAEPYVSILAFCLMDNHLHILMRELVEKGISKFMQRVARSMAAHHNARYEESGVLFEGRFRAHPVLNDRHAQYLATYINIKNPFERFPGGITAAVENFDSAYRFAVDYPFSSTADFAGLRRSALIDHAARQELFQNAAHFRTAARDLMESRVEFLADDNLA